MKAQNKIIIIGIALLLSITSQGQPSSKSPCLIHWENGNVTNMYELDKVWIKLNSGDIIKKAKIWDFQKDKGMIVYEKEGSLHDLLIANIDKIYAGRNSVSVLYFDKANNPKIKSSGSYYDEFTGYTDFKISQKASEVIITEITTPVTETKSTSVIDANPKTDMVEKNNITLSDTIVKGNGQIVFAKIMSMTDTEIRYKRIDLPEGPDYILGTNACEEIIKNTNSIKIIMKKP